jgi:hypothetical protein
VPELDLGLVAELEPSEFGLSQELERAQVELGLELYPEPEPDPEQGWGA